MSQPEITRFADYWQQLPDAMKPPMDYPRKKRQTVIRIKTEQVNDDLLKEFIRYSGSPKQEICGEYTILFLNKGNVRTWAKMNVERIHSYGCFADTILY